MIHLIEQLSEVLYALKYDEEDLNNHYILPFDEAGLLIYHVSLALS